ncbi:MAG: LTA synthase family protein [Saprospiraceae bacterium]|uniref:LTA synthase family protein n=1 Tax=Candidatus Opimibacter skivensis TaxID=2982028 RepID=A0A9D7ST52_9BACT|nr:LTA synthase family protein [Candidatus Opimibacter skivensis]
MLKSVKPNIVIIILESWTADIIRSLGGENNITPNFDTLSKQGLLFTQIYAAGSRTEHGLISVLSGFPPPPLISIISIPSKSEKLKSINNVFADDGYSSSFYYGGESGFVNMKSYLINSGFTTIVDKASFTANQLNSKWGAHDQYVFERQLLDLKIAHEPFLSVLLTLSSHEPFEVPMETPFDDDHSEPGKFRKAAFYSDHCLGEYFRAAKKESWYDNTLFILVADHGHRLPKERDFNMPESKRIPLLFFGNVLQENIRGATIDKTCNQNDIAATLLSQLNKNYSDFPSSRDILNPGTKNFAYYTNDNVWGWITPEQKFIYTYATQTLSNTGSTSLAAPLNDSIVLDAKAYIQTHYQRYLSF